MSNVSSSSSANANASARQRPLSLGVIFLTLYIDLIGFSIIFPLAPDLLKHYLAIDGAGAGGVAATGVLGWFLAQLNSISAALGNTTHLPEVLFGGAVSSVFSVLQFIFSPLWGGLSDRMGRRGVLMLSVLGTAASYLVWAFSGSFWLFLVSRILGGAFGGNMSVATAAVADVTTREERSKAMGLVGAAFGLGLVTGPLVGAFSAHINLLETFPARAHTLAALGVNPFSMPALIAFALSLANLVWINARFRETLPPEARAALAKTRRVRNPVRAILSLDNAPVRAVNLVTFIYTVGFVAMETSLVFLGAERFGYTARQNGLLMGFLGLCSIITQGAIVRRLYKRLRETTVLALGLACSAVGLLAIGFTPTPALLYAGTALLALGSGLVNPSTSGLISLYAGASEQGMVLGIFRSLGALARAVTPILAGILFFAAGSRALYIIAAALTLVALALGKKLPQPEK